MSVNARSEKPRSPFSWVTEDECLICGRQYKQSYFGVSWQDGLSDFKSMNPEGYRSRGPVLWLMRCRKLTLWFAAHEECEPVPF